MNISFWSYELKTNERYRQSFSFETRQGAILKIEDVNGIGYADCHPWTEFGDVPLQKQLDLLKQNQTTPLTKQSLYFAKIDAMARAKGENLLLSNPKQESHALLASPTELTADYLNGLKHLGYNHAKLKIGKNLPEALAQLNSLPQVPIWLRLDANAKLSDKQIAEFWKSLTPQARAMIEFIEDPCPFSPDTWRKLKSLGIRIAKDFEGTMSLGQPYDVVVLKPAVQQAQDVIKLLQGEPLRFSVTTYLDHPFGQVCAAWTAGEIAKLEPKKITPGGFLSHLVYEIDDFSECLMGDAPYLKAPKGKGFGFDSLLAGLQWQPLTNS